MTFSSGNLGGCFWGPQMLSCKNKVACVRGMDPMRGRYSTVYFGRFWAPGSGFLIRDSHGGFNDDMCFVDPLFLVAFCHLYYRLWCQTF